MILYPAIDIAAGRAVRLRQGDFDDETVYHDDPLDAARAWVQAGCRALHVVDLDGARAGTPVNLERVTAITGELDVPVQLGGGLRSLDSMEAAFGAGVGRVILGTAALTDQALLDQALARWGERVVVSVDVRAGRVATAGWLETSELTASLAFERLGARGVREFVYSDIERDGMLSGPDLDAVARAAHETQGSLIYSGGIGGLADLEALVSLGAPGLDGVIVGKALYERRFTVGEAVTALGG